MSQRCYEPKLQDQGALAVGEPVPNKDSLESRASRDKAAYEE